MHPNMEEANDTHCRRCNREWQPGDFPFCKGEQWQHENMQGFNDPLSAYVDEHILPEGRDVGYNESGEKVVGTLITDRGHRNQIMKEHNLHRDRITSKKRHNPEYDRLTEKVHHTIMERIRNGDTGERR